jgi:hypothetical protein
MVRVLAEDLGIDGSIISEQISEKYGGKVWTGFIWLRIGTSGGLICSIKSGEFLD